MKGSQQPFITSQENACAEKKELIYRSKKDFESAGRWINSQKSLTPQGKHDVWSIALWEHRKSIFLIYVKYDPNNARSLSPFMIRSELAMSIYKFLAGYLKIPENTVPPEYQHLCKEYYLTDYVSPLGINTNSSSADTKLVFDSWDYWVRAVKEVSSREFKAKRMTLEEMLDLQNYEMNKRHNAIHKFYQEVYPKEVRPPVIRSIINLEQAEKHFERLESEIFRVGEFFWV